MNYKQLCESYGEAQVPPLDGTGRRDSHAEWLLTLEGVSDQLLDKVTYNTNIGTAIRQGVKAGYIEALNKVARGNETARDPRELANRLKASVEQAGENNTNRLVKLVDEFCAAADAIEDDIGGHRSLNDIIGEIGPLLNKVAEFRKAHRGLT